jgi:hypothetical protein
MYNLGAKRIEKPFWSEGRFWEMVWDQGMSRK